MEYLSKPRIVVILGGSSRERAISLTSGKAVFEALKRQGFDVAQFDPAYNSPKTLSSERFDIAFIALHGKGGEDGAIQRLLEKRGIPYVGSAPFASRDAFNKKRAKVIFVKSSIPTPEYEVLNARNYTKALKRWRAPYVIKPLEEGSSIGVIFVERNGTRTAQIRQSIKQYGELLIEPKIVGREYTVGILGDEALPVIELKPKRAFYDFKAKYTKGLTEYLVPAPIDAALRRQLQEMALRVHQALGLRDLSRVDFRVDESGEPFVLEANSIPGFTETSLLPKAAKHVGISFDALCVRLMRMAEARKPVACRA